MRSLRSWSMGRSRPRPRSSACTRTRCATGCSVPAAHARWMYETPTCAWRCCYTCAWPNAHPRTCGTEPSHTASRGLPRQAGGMSTENFSRPDHVVVVGAGMVGLATAWYLQQEGVQVTVVDGDGVAAGSSWGNAGWLAPSLTLPLPEPAVLATGLRALTSPNSPLYVPFRFNPRFWQFLLGFARHCTPRAWRRAIMVFNKANRLALGAYADLTDDEGAARVAEPTKAAEPFLAAFSDEKSLQGLTEELEQVAKTGGPASFEVLTGEEARALQPALSERVTGGLHLHGQRFINPGRFASALAEAVQRQGGQIRTGMKVSAVRRAGAGIVIESGEEPVLRADAAVLATGTWLGDLARAHGVRQVVQAGRGYSFTVHPQQVPTGPVYLPAQRVACTP